MNEANQTSPPPVPAPRRAPVEERSKGWFRKRGDEPQTVGVLTSDVLSLKKDKEALEQECNDYVAALTEARQDAQELRSNLLDHEQFEANLRAEVERLKLEHIEQVCGDGNWSMVDWSSRALVNEALCLRVEWSTRGRYVLTDVTDAGEPVRLFGDGDSAMVDLAVRTRRQTVRARLLAEREPPVGPEVGRSLMQVIDDETAAAIVEPGPVKWEAALEVGE